MRRYLILPYGNRASRQTSTQKKHTNRAAWIEWVIKICKSRLMINMKDDMGSGEEERSEAKTDFWGLRETAESRDHRERVEWGGRGEETKGLAVGVRRNKLSKREREERVKRYRGDVRCDGSWAKDGSCVIDLSPLWLPSGCVSAWACVCVCVLVSLQLYSRPAFALNTTGCRSKSLDHGLPVNGFPVHPRVTREYTPMCLHLLPPTCAHTHNHCVTPANTGANTSTPVPLSTKLPD